MASGRPQGRNDPSLISSLETAVRQVHRPGPIGLAWNWRFELAILAAVTGMSIAITGSIGLIGLAAVSGAGLAAGAALLCWPPARRQIIARAWCVITPHRVRAGCVNAWVQTRSGQAADHLVRHADGLRRAASAVVPGRHHRRRPDRRQRGARGRLLGGRGPRRGRRQARAPGHAGGNKKQSSRTDRADSLRLAAPSPRGRRRRGRAR